MIRKNLGILAIVLFGMTACRDYTPKPYAYPRVHYPEKEYQLTETNCPFEFETPVYSSMVKVPDEKYDCWYDLKYLPFNATLHLSYKPMASKESLDSLAEDAYKLAFDHISKAEEIIEREIRDTALGLYGMIYDLEGRTATPFNFYLTDEKEHFFRGSFYFNSHTDLDSVAPIYEFLRKDIMHAIKTFKWKYSNEP